MKKIVLLGAPGSGKGTLASILVNEHHFKHISTGDLFRKVINSNTPLASQLKQIVSTGALVSDEITNAIMKEEILTLINQKNSFILDGYPRTIEQARFLDGIMSPDLILLMDIDHDLAIKRVVGRRLCPKCGTIYNIYYKKPKVENVCDHDGAFLIQRKDDTEATINKRLALYQQVTSQLITYYEHSGKLYHIDANRGIDLILPEVMKLITK